MSRFLVKDKSTLSTVFTVITFLNCSSYIISNIYSIAINQFFYILIAPGKLHGFRVSNFWLKIILGTNRYIICTTNKHQSVNISWYHIWKSVWLQMSSNNCFSDYLISADICKIFTAPYVVYLTVISYIFTCFDIFRTRSPNDCCPNRGSPVRDRPIGGRPEGLNLILQ